MFIKLDSTNYFIIPDNKSPREIVNELILRMNKKVVTKDERIEIHKVVLEHLLKR